MLGGGFGWNGSETMKKGFYGSVNMKCESYICGIYKMVSLYKFGKAINKISNAEMWQKDINI